MFCVECGKEGSIFKDGVCIDCYLKTHSFTSGPSIIDLPICTHCNSYKYKNTWTTELLGDVLRRIVKNTFKIGPELNKIDINTECKEAKDGMQCKVYISGFIDDVEITEEHDLDIRLKRTVCDVCSKKYGGYHEAIIQIRADKRTLTKDELNNIQLSVENLVENMQAKGNRTVFVTDIAEEHDGLDFYISDKNAAQIIAKNIKNQYGGVIKQSSKNIGMKDSRQIYRMTYSLRLPSYKKGDFLELNNLFYQVVSIHGNKIKMIDLSDWTENLTDIKAIHKAHILGGKELVKEMILVSQTENEVQIMDPKNYKTFEIKKPKKITFKSKNINIIKLENQLFIEK
jgi:nonsense-mediated mRNA decay protein 3